MEGIRAHTFPICLFHFCTPTLTFTVFSIKPADTTTAFVCRVTEAAIFWTDILLYSLESCDVAWDSRCGCQGVKLLSRRFFRSVIWIM